MEIIIKGEPKEIAALALELQERQDLANKVELNVNGHDVIKATLAAIRDKSEGST